MFYSKKIFFLITSLFLSIFIINTSNAEVLSDETAADIIEPENTYNSDAPILINLFAKTIIEEGNCITDDYDGCTFNDVLNDVISSDDFKPEVKVHITGDNYPDDGLLSNAKIRQRGATSRFGAQKSFRIKLDKDIPLWRGERRIQLLKSFFDLSRIRNKLSYDLFADIPNLPSMRSEFVKLTLEDQGVTQDMGLFTQVEYFGKEYLERRGWDKDSRIYKSNLFYFQYRDAFALDADGEPVDEDEFEKYLEIKRGDTHQELIDMILAVNDFNLDFQTEVFNKYFNLDNYLSWFAVNILTNNTDTTAQNYYLYNPIDTENFYFVPWDYDYAWAASLEGDSFEFKPRWWYSHGNHWGNNFNERFLRTPGNLALLKSAIDEIKQEHLTVEKIMAKRDAYYDVIFPTITTSRDWDFIYIYGTDPEKVAQYNQIFDALSNNVEENYALFLERLNDPMPFYMSDAEVGENNKVFFNWGKSESLSNQTIIYDLEIATDKFFNTSTIIQTITGITESEYLLDWIHPKGNYFFRVVSRDAADPENHWQIGYDSLLRNSNDTAVIYGVKPFFVAQDGTEEPPEPSDAVSNPVLDTALVLDGDSSDWNSLVAFNSDANDIANDAQNNIDWDANAIAHSDDNIYLLYKNHNAIDASSSGFIPWGWQMLIDADNNPETGFKFSNALGADFIIEGTTFESYSGTGTNWSWNVIGNLSKSIANNIGEFSFPRSWLGSTESMQVVFSGANASYGGNTTDLYPDGAQTNSATVRSFEYSFGEITPPLNNAPLASGQNLSLVENTSATILLDASDEDDDTLNLIITQQPTQGLLSISEGSLSVAYTPNPNYRGSDSFSFKVNDGLIDSNEATVNLEIVADESIEGISNSVVAGGLNIDGNNTDWNGLTFFESDPADVANDQENPIDWLNAAMAHSSDTVYLTYNNSGLVNPPRQSGTSLNWGWQTFIDIDRDVTSGYSLNDSMGAEYLIEGAYVYQYAGNGDSWQWVELGIASSKYQQNTIELSFPRTWMTLLNNVNIVFFGNNAASNGDTQDSYPNQGSFTYSFGGNGEFGDIVEVDLVQRQASPASHQPVIANQTPAPIENDVVDNTPDDSIGTTDSSGGGSFSWMLLFSIFLLKRRRIHISMP